MHMRMPAADNGNHRRAPWSSFTARPKESKGAAQARCFRCFRCSTALWQSHRRCHRSRDPIDRCGRRTHTFTRYPQSRSPAATQCYLPITDVIQVMSILKTQSKSRLVGANAPGIIAPIGQCRIGFQPLPTFAPGHVGIAAKSGTLSYEAVASVTRAGLYRHGW
jgi:hypothetical protein